MLKVTNLGKEYRGKVALNEINLTFPNKGLVIIKGESGSGKTTLLNMLTALDYPTRGKMQFNGVDITPKNSEQFRMKYCGNIYQDYMLIEDLSIKENIEIAMQACGQEYSIEDVKDLLRMVDLPQDYLDKKTAQLSGGEKQRVAIARAIAKKDAMIFADEPTGNLDSKNGKIIMDLLKEIAKDRLVVVVSHNEKYNAQYADYSIILEDGVVEFCDLPDVTGQESCTTEFDKKSKLKSKTIARLAFWGFEKNRVKTVVSMIAFVILAIFSLLATVAFIGDANLAYARSLSKCDKKNVFVKAEGDFLSVNNKDFDFDNLEKFRENINYGSSNVYYFDFAAHNVEDYDSKKEQEYYNLYQSLPFLSQLIIYDNQMGADVDVLYGNFPQKYNDIMLPYCYAKYMSQVFLNYQCDDVADLVGKDFIYTKNRYDRDKEYFAFNICGIFEEGDYYTDYGKDIDRELVDFYKRTNLLAQSAFVAPETKEILFNNAYLFNGLGGNSYTFGKFYSITQIDGNSICPYAFDKYNEYLSAYAPLNKGEVYMDKTLAQSLGIKAGDVLSNTKLENFNLGSALQVERDFDGLVVKDIFNLPDKKEFVIFSQEDYYDTIMLDTTPKAFLGYYFNAKNVNDTYKFFNDISKKGKMLDIFSMGFLDSVYTQNIHSTSTIYTIFIAFRYTVWLPVMLLSYIGMIAMGFVSFGYLISAKAKSYNVLRSLGFGRRNISLLLLVQVVAIVFVECILGIFLGWLGCNLLGKAIISFSTPNVPLSIASEELMPIGYVAPIVLVCVSLVLGGLIVLAKTRALFSKSIIENKVN